MERKYCKVCNEEKSIEEFFKGHARCKKCFNEFRRTDLNRKLYLKLYRSDPNNKERIKKAKAKFRSNPVNKMKEKEYDKKYNETHRKERAINKKDGYLKTSWRIMKCIKSIQITA